MKFDSLRTEDVVKVDIFDATGRELYTLEGRGFHNLDSAVETAFAKASLPGEIQNYVFRVSDLDSSVSHRYRINADGHLTLIV